MLETKIKNNNILCTPHLDETLNVYANYSRALTSALTELYNWLLEINLKWMPSIRHTSHTGHACSTELTDDLTTLPQSGKSVTVNLVNLPCGNKTSKLTKNFAGSRKEWAWIAK